MAISRWLNTVSTIVLAAFFAADGAEAQGTQKIGVASAVKNKVETGGARQLTAGSSVFAREVVRTGEQSAAQLLFLDETSLSIGPQSEVTLDRFVFDPNRGAGSVVLNATKGALRFVSGSQQSSSYQVRTPVATIGVRGTIFDIYIGIGKDGPYAIVILVEGSLTANGRTLNKAGQALIFSKGGVQQVNWDSTLFSVVGGTWSFPLFGNHWRMETPDWAKQDFDQDRIEQLFGGGPTFDPYGGYGN
ncbi:MAG TPA: FecR domain-containing protein [Xanthobacteraceae bacterium]|nr:FecR domain-containing protein [Xanthobacteraceae bacterium]